ncbi:MucBP domain-containing protein [Enterococcus casseliflavus]|uniref:MucBP domain-containing protein n=1 Tax=Enterococcus casseliflavus TaxID=37734 RepID=UPI00254351F4|nr:MucBP domain-containing protein [Enterococcus casseliflavus]MDK4448971.1 MucBP domain-containing protein [Enterococcus casseliflavus]
MNKKRLIHNLVVASAVGAMTVAPLMSPNILTLGKGATVVYADTKDFVMDTSTDNSDSYISGKSVLTIKGATQAKKLEVGDIVQMTVTVKGTVDNNKNNSYIAQLKQKLDDEYQNFEAELTNTYLADGKEYSFNTAENGYKETKQIDLSGNNDKITYVFSYKVTKFTTNTYFQRKMFSVVITRLVNPDKAVITADNKGDFIQNFVGLSNYSNSWESVKVNYVLEGDRKTQIADSETLELPLVAVDSEVDGKTNGAYINLQAKALEGYDFKEFWGNGITLTSNTTLDRLLTTNELINGINLVYVPKDTPVVPVPTPDFGILTVKYQDKEGNDLDSPTYQNVEVNKEYTATAKNFEGYTLDGEATIKGNMTKDGQTIVFSYNKIEVTPTPEEPETPTEPETSTPEVIEPTIPEDLVDENTTTETPDENTLEVQETDESISTTKLVLISILSLIFSGGIIYALVNNDAKRLKGFNRFKK